MRLIISLLCCIVSSSLFADVFLIKLKADKKLFATSNSVSEQQILLDGQSFNIKSNDKIQVVSLPTEPQKERVLIQ